MTEDDRAKECAYLNSTLSFPTLPNTASAVGEERTKRTQNEFSYEPSGTRRTINHETDRRTYTHQGTQTSV